MYQIFQKKITFDGKELICFDLSNDRECCDVQWITSCFLQLQHATSEQKDFSTQIEAAGALIDKLITENIELVEKVLVCFSPNIWW